MQFTFPNSHIFDENNIFDGCFFLQYQEAGFCEPGTCEQHTFLPKPVERIDSKRYRNMFFYSSQASRSGIFKKPEATHWGIYYLPARTFLISDVIVHSDEKVVQHRGTPIQWEDQQFYLKLHFTAKYINYKITPYQSFTKALMASAAIDSPVQ